MCDYQRLNLLFWLALLLFVVWLFLQVHSLVLLFISDGLFQTKRGDTLTPVTVNQLFYSATPMGGQEEGFMLDGKLLGYVCVIGQVLERQEHEANITLTVDDSSGTIDVCIFYHSKFFFILLLDLSSLISSPFGSFLILSDQSLG